MTHKTFPVLIAIILLTLLVVLPRHVLALFEDVALEVKELVLGKENKNMTDNTLSVGSSIELAPEGDENGNGEVDAGDIVRFSYTITNTTTASHTFAVLKTNINRNDINFIHNVMGVTGLSEDNDTITFPNLRIPPSSTSTIQFDARVNYVQEEISIKTEPELVSSDNTSLVKSSLKEIKAKKLSKEEVDKRMENRGMLLQLKNTDL